MRAATAAVQTLVEHGVRYAFSVPGESFLGLLDALRDTPEIHLISTRHEGAAAFMAEAVGKLTGTPAICMGTRGVGTANLAIGIHTAYQDSTPLIALLGQVETPFRHREAFQEVELGPFLDQITKWSIEVPSSERLPDLVGEGFRRSLSGRPGPVALAIRGDLLDGEAPNELPVASAPASAAPTANAVDAAIALLRYAERPLIIAGGGVLHSRATPYLIALAERTGVPVMSAFRRHDVFPNDHPFYLGSLSLGAPPCVPRRAREADVVLAIGTRLGETTTFGYTIPSPGTTLIHADRCPDLIGQTYPAQVAIAADAQETIKALLTAAVATEWPDRMANNSHDRAAFIAATTPPAAPTVRQLVDPGLVIAELQRQLPSNAVITTDAGNFYGWFSRYFRFHQPRTYLGPISGAMGYAVPAAVAAGLINQNQTPIVALVGDGGFLMTGSELAVAAQHGINLTCIVFNNAMYGTIRMHQERAYPDRAVGTDLSSPDFARYAEAFGGLGIRIEDNADVTDGVRQVLTHQGIALLEVMVARESIAVGQSLADV